MNKKVMRKVIVFVLVALFCTVTVFASELGEGDFSSDINNTYTLLRNIALPIAALGLAYCGLSLLIGSETDAEKAKTRIKLIIIAVCILILLPSIINGAKSIGEEYAWDPYLGTQSSGE